MLAMSDVSMNNYLSFFTKNNLEVAFLVPTPTGYDKSIMDATKPIKYLLKKENIHDYDKQLQGQENKKVLDCYFVHHNDLEKTYASLYRPLTKKGDPRIWFHNLKKYCSPKNLLAVFVKDKNLYVINLSLYIDGKELESNLALSKLLERTEFDEIANELYEKILAIHNKGFIKSRTNSDSGVGETLEQELGIKRNNSKSPDYKGIELKTTRINRGGKKRSKTRCTLFTKVPDFGLTYHELLLKCGKFQAPNNAEQKRLQLYNTVKANTENSHNLMFKLDYDKDELMLVLKESFDNETVLSGWELDELRNTLEKKHKETFWIEAESKIIDGDEYFRYDIIHHTKKPNLSLLGPLIDSGVITMDLAAHLNPDGSYKDHGMLFKINPDNIDLLLNEVETYNLNQCI